MIVSHKYRFIFLRTEKTASTSMISALQGILGENDVQASSDRPPWAKFSPIHHRALRRHCPQWFGLHTHATASQVRDVIGRKIFDSYYKFVVERNPWDRQVSLYAHRQWKKGQTPEHFDRDMRSFVYRNTSYVRLNNWSKYAIGREIVADRVIRYERLADEIGDLAAMLGLPGPLDLPTLRKYTDDRPHYASYYSDATRDLIGGWYAREIDALGYTFENETAARRVSAAPLAAPLADRSRKGIRQSIGGGQGVFDAEQTVVHSARLAGAMSSSRRKMAG
jgi:hypothetical protein